MFEADLEQLRVSKLRSSMLEASVEAATHACRSQMRVILAPIR
jgi:hypothetical protein